jgi:two-component system response regulator RegA
VRYLLVDDDAVFRARLTQALEKRGHAVVGVGTVAEAVNRIETDPPERMVVDLRMSGETGLDLLGLLQERRIAIPTVVLTGFGSIATTQEAMRRGAVGYLTKPCSLERVLAAFEPSGGVEPERIPLPSLEQVEWEHVQRVLSDCGGNVTRAAKILGIHRRSLQRRLAKPPPLQ